MKKVKMALIGAGQRGMDSYAPYALKNPNQVEFVAVAEPDAIRRNKFKEAHGISDDMTFGSWEELLEQPKFADAILIATQDQMHLEPTVKALRSGYHVLLEKPMSNNLEECIELAKTAEETGKVLAICHVLRYTNFFETIKKILDSGKIGRLITIRHSEYVCYWHQAHSFVRGNWGNKEKSSPMILAKSCHDMDILSWLAGADCKKVSSFGDRYHFRKEDAPEGAPMRCTDGCPAEKECPYFAPNQYLTDKITWPTSVISEDMSFEGRMKALQEGPYGRCVYHCDNDVVDNQIVNLEFENGVTASFIMTAFTTDGDREMRIMGTNGDIRASMHKNTLEIMTFNNGNKEIIEVSSGGDMHGGGDYGLFADFIEVVREDGKKVGKTTVAASLQSHLMAFGAEKSRVEGRTIELEELTSSK